MIITRMKAKNQLTIPSQIVKRMKLRPDELFSIDVRDNFIKLTPVEIESKYSVEDLETINKIVKEQKNKAKIVKPGKAFSRYIKKINK